MVEARHVTPVAMAGAQLGEGPFWHRETSSLLWVDLAVGALHRLVDAEDGVVYCAGEPLSVVRTRAGGGFALAQKSGVHLVDSDFVGDLLCSISDVPGLWPNDGACDPDGRLWIGLTDESGRQGAGRLVRVDGSGRVDVVRTGLTLPNGIGWSCDGRTMYVVESHTSTLYRYRYTAGRTTDERVVTRFPQAFGVPDGLAVDASDHVWLAFYGSGRVRRLLPSGAIVDEISFPTPHVTSCCFGGADGGRLFVTSADWHRTGGPSAGAVFAVDVGTSGAPVYEFAG